jgi:hypothetical protein
MALLGGCRPSVLSIGRGGEARAENGHTLRGDEGYELADAFLHALLGLLCNLGVLRERILHDPGDWSKVSDVSIVYIVLVSLGGGGSGVPRRLGRGGSVRHGPGSEGRLLVFLKGRSK